MKFIIGTKEQMTQFFNEDGVVVPATIISVPQATVTQVKSIDTDGYTSVQIASGERKEKNINKAQRGHFAGKGNFRFVKEFRLKNDESSDMNVGDTLDASIFEVGDVVAVSGTSKGPSTMIYDLWPPAMVDGGAHQPSRDHQAFLFLSLCSV